MSRVVQTAAAAALLALSGLFASAFYTRHWVWRDCFNELGRCYDPASEEVFLEQAGIVWGGLAGLSLLGAVIFLLRRHRGV